MAGICQAILLLAIVGLCGLRLLLLQLPVHMDEYDYLFIGRELVNGGSWPSLSYVFGANFNWYLFGWFNQTIDGICTPAICTPRLLSSILGFLSLGACFVFTRSLSRSNPAALLATLLLASSAPHAFVSSITTYDVVAFAFFSWSVALSFMLFKAHADKQAGLQQSIASRYTLVFFLPLLVTLAAAVLSKYIVLLLLPGMFLLSLLMTPVWALSGAVLLCVLLTAYYLLNRSSLQILLKTQVNGIHGANITRDDLLQQFVGTTGLMLFALLLATVLLVVRGIFKRQSGRQHSPSSAVISGIKFLDFIPSKTTKTISLLLLILLAITLPVYHLATANRIAFAKHLVYTYFFVLPLLACLLVVLYEQLKRYFRSAAVPTMVLFAFVSLFGMNQILQLSELERGYPDMNDLVSFWVKQRHNDDTTYRVLSEDPYLFRYLAGHGFEQSRISETTHLDNNLDGQFTTQDVIDALWDKKYQWVLLTDQIHPTDNTHYRHILKLQDYTAVFNQPYYLSGLLGGNHLGNVQLFKLQ